MSCVNIQIEFKYKKINVNIVVLEIPVEDDEKLPDPKGR